MMIADKFYGRRKGKALKPGRIILMEKLLPQVMVSPCEGPIEEALKNPQPIDVDKLFDFQPKDLVLEVGFGGGEHLSEMALRSPDTGFIGAEVFVNGVAHLLGYIGQVNEDKSVSLQEGRADNIRIFNEDVRLLFPFLKKGIFSRIYVLFPDPWPKTRHEKRRFIGEKNLPRLAELLKDNGELVVATDVPLYADWTISEVEKSDLFVLKNQDTRKRPEDWIPTRYEEKGLEAGRLPYYFIFTKK